MTGQSGEALNYSSGHDEYLASKVVWAAGEFIQAVQAARDEGLNVGWERREYHNIEITDIRRETSLLPRTGDPR